MIIAVIAAQGRSGQAFVEAALKAGHTVRAGILGDSPFSSNEHLETLQCDATNVEQVSQLLSGCDAVVSLIGHVKGSSATVQTDATKVATEAMKLQGVKRYVGLTGTGARIDGDTPSVIDEILTKVISTIDPNRVADGKAHLAVLREGGVDFTVIRVLKLSGGRPGKFQLTSGGPAKLLTSRSEVAQAILQVLANENFMWHFPVISR